MSIFIVTDIGWSNIKIFNESDWKLKTGTLISIQVENQTNLQYKHHENQNNNENLQLYIHTGKASWHLTFHDLLQAV